MREGFKVTPLESQEPSSTELEARDNMRKIRDEIETLEEVRKSVARTLDAHHVPEISQKLLEIDDKLKVLRKKEEAEREKIK